ncbi:hypothetical protein [Streptomyces nigrescens]|uniref:hypothetical protein n=1 Tax=Streptomyces nigrescens TaxID=1920 RepID=UPI003489AE80
MIEGEGPNDDSHRKCNQPNGDDRDQQVPEFIMNGAVDLDPDGNEEHGDGGGLSNKHDRLPPSLSRRIAATLMKHLLDHLEDSPAGDPVQNRNHDPKHRRNNLPPRIFDHIIDGTAEDSMVSKMSTAQSSFTRRLLQSRCRNFHTVFMQRGGNFGMPQIQEHPDRVAPAPRGH